MRKEWISPTLPYDGGSDARPSESLLVLVCEKNRAPHNSDECRPFAEAAELMSDNRPVRTLADVERAVRAVAIEFNTDKVFIIGSQSILLGWPDAPARMRVSPEIDLYPENAKEWETEERKKHPDESPEASEQINALFGSGSQFHRTHGFYIDGVDQHTARLPDGWQTRAVVREVRLGKRTVTAIAPCPDDLIVSKLARLDDKDKDFIEAYYAVQPIDVELIEERIALCNFEPEIGRRASDYIKSLAKRIESSRRTKPNESS